MKMIQLLIFIMVLTTSCMPEQRVQDLDENANNSTSSNDDSGSIDEVPSSGDSTSFATDVAWYNFGLTSETLTVDADNAKTIYLVGDDVHNYLSNAENFSATYCIEALFQKNGTEVPKRLRVKVVPAYTNDFAQGQSTRFFRVNLNTDSGNNYCDKPTQELVNGSVTSVLSGDSNHDGLVNANDTTIAYKPLDVCPSCLNIIATESAVLYKYDTTNTVLTRVETDKVKYQDLILRVNLNSNSTPDGNTCSDSACQSSGFNCCVDGQCVNEKSVKISGVQANPNGFTIAEREKFSDANWYKNYPQYYYICLEQVPGDTDNGGNPTEPEDPAGDAQARLDALIADYKCVDELTTNSESDPFHRNPINNSASYSLCEKTTTTDTMYYQSVMKRLYTNCGCIEKDNLTTMVDICPAYTYKPVYQTDSQGQETTNVIAINCVTPAVTQTPLPFQNLEVAVSSRSAPHRFFDNLNFEYDPDKGLSTGANGVQEGTAFQYLDDAYIFPLNNSFNMNSILGQMTVNLDQARPAKIIDIEFDKQYIISTLNGLYSGCPTCAKDTWFSNFSPNPVANRGVGLQAVGFTTRRDTYGTNLTLGNYGDTIFGRACWVPPTMLPYGHSEKSSNQDQRLNRLNTQAALYANGYQRDWFGFNKGALIGSFDGVTWFAVGKGRIVKSTSTKLFLAINAPFADLASPSDHTISVQEYEFTATAPIVDWDPSLEINDPSQNEAGSCQQYHSCEKDSHCITKLGWEYVCADVTYSKTKWPNFNPAGAIETASSSKTGSISQFLQQGSLPSGSTTKRCIYRGAGSPCRTDSNNITDQGLRKNLTCAPNFYCANVNSANSFNDEVARFGKPLDELVESKNHRFGQDANIIGRPKDYISSGNLNTLTTDIISTITENVLLMDSGATGKVGLCRPGKLLPSYNNFTETNNWDQAEQHQAADPEYRTDYISQIAGCNSALFTDLRYSSCPMLDETGNYIHTQDDYLNDNFLVAALGTAQSKKVVTERYTFAQNTCGLESLSSSASISISSTGDSLANFSAFKTIEGRSLASSNTIVEETLARDSCLRKAGAVCHTDLDCSPNRLMAEKVDLVPAAYFGNNAEKLYYEESLVCGQAEKEPNLGDDNFNTYTLHNNRCCRPIGEELTMYTEDSNGTDALASVDLRTDIFGALNPTHPNRYSRYAVSDSPINSTTKESTLIRPSANTEDIDGNKSLDNNVNITNSNQWQTIHNTAAKTCCGGTWVRKFADGTNNWSKQRLSLDVSSFKCINQRSPLYLTEEPSAFGISSNSLDKDKADFCTDPTLNRGGCIEKGIGEINDFNITPPIINTFTSTIIIDSDKDVMAPIWDINPWSFTKLIPADADANDIDGTNLVMDWTVLDKTEALRTNITTVLPAYIAFNAISDITIELENPDGATYSVCSEITPASFDCGGTPDRNGLCGPTADWSAAGNLACNGTGANCCFMYNTTNRLLIVAHTSATQANTAANFDANGNVLSAKITYTAPGTLLWEQNNTSATTVDDNAVLVHRRSSTPGNAMYYLKRLAKFEYLGIPQMTYEPVYCNDNYQKMVPGIFHESAFGQALKNVNDFINHEKTFIDTGVSRPWASDTAAAPQNADSLNINLVAGQELVDHNAIFSDNKFKCCLELNTTTNDAGSCCTGFAADEDGNTVPDPNSSNLKCKIPSGTNLNVYFNKFVSGEGMKDFDGGVPLTSDDFDSKTGEPKTSTTVINKLIAMGQSFCASGTTRRGGVFGNFQAKPYGPLREPVSGNDGDTLFTIVDDVFDNGSINNRITGYQMYSLGYKWNHHVYCDGTGN